MVSSSSPKGKLLWSSWHPFRQAFMQCGRTGKDTVLWHWPTGVIAQLSVSPHHSARDGTIWFLTAFANTTDQGHQSRIHISWWLLSTQSHTGRWVDWIGLCSVLSSCQHSIGYMGDGFYRSKDPTNSIKVLKDAGIVQLQLGGNGDSWLPDRFV